MMDSERFNLVFSGELVRGAELNQSKANLAKLFGISANKVETLFSGKPITLKRGLAFDAANTFRVAMKKAGCRVDLVTVTDTKPSEIASTPAREANTPRDASAGAVSPQQTPVPEPSAHTAGSRPETPVSEAADTGARAAIEEHEMLAPIGETLLREDEREVVEAVSIDVSHIELRDAAGGPLIDDSEREQVEALVVDVDIELAALGGDLLSEEEREAVPAQVVRVPEYQVASAGEDLGQLIETKPALNPDTSHLELE